MTIKENDRAKRIVKFHEKKVGERANWDDHWYNTAFYVIPELDDVYEWQHKSKGEEKHYKLYDNSAEHNNELLSSALMSMAINPTSQWFELTTGDPQLDKVAGVRKYLQETVRIALNILNNTNFHPEAGGMFKGLNALGTGPLMMFEDDEFVVRFQALPVYMVYLGENNRGLVSTMSQEKKMTVYQAYAEYGKDKFPEDIQRKYDKDLDKDIIIVHLLMERKEAELRGFVEPRKGRKRKKNVGVNKDLVSLHVLKDKPVFLKEAGFDEFPGAVPRWSKTPGEVYGRGPGMKALPEIRMVNQMRKVTIRGAQKIVDPPLLAPDDGIMGRVNTRPGGITTYRAGTNDRVESLNTNANVPVGLDLVEDSRGEIRKYFFIDQLQLREGPQMTATEVNERIDQSLRLLGPMLTRLEFELLQPIVARLIRIMKDNDLLPPDPPEELDGINPRARFSSQIAKAQRAIEAQSIERFLGSVAPIVELDPSTMDHLNIPSYLQVMADSYSVPQEIFNDPAKVKKMQEQRAAQAEDERRRQVEMEDAEKVSKVAPAIKAEG